MLEKGLRDKPFVECDCFPCLLVPAGTLRNQVENLITFLGSQKRDIKRGIGQCRVGASFRSWSLFLVNGLLSGCTVPDVNTKQDEGA